MAKKKSKTADKGDAEDVMSSVVLKDAQGNYTYIGKNVAKEEPTEEEVAEASEDAEWYDTMLDPDGYVEVEDLGEATGENYADD
jgi:hypothetical protein